MSLLDRIRDLLYTPEDIEVDASNAQRFLEDERGDELEQAEQRAEELVEETDDHIEAFQEAIEELRGYEPDKGDLEQQGQHVERQLQAIGDTIESFCRSRSRLLDRFDPPEEIEAHHDALEELIEELDDVSQKEGMVLDQTGQGSAVSRELNAVMQHADTIETFLEQEYRVVSAHSEIGELQDRRQEIAEEIEELRDRISAIDIQDPRDEIEEVEDQIEDLRDGERYQRLEELRAELEAEREEREAAEEELSRIAGEMERGLKKLLYAIEHSEVAFDADPRVLRRLRDEEFDAIDAVGPVLDEAVRVLEDGDILGDRQLGSFRDAADRMRDLDDRKDAIAAHEDRIEELEQEIDDIEVEDEIEELADEIEQLRQTAADREDQVRKLEDRIERLRDERSEIEDEIGELLDGVSRDNITVG